MKLLPAKKGTCCMCATAHGEHEAHNFQSLFYGMRFKMKYGREATCADSVAHLPPKLQAAWKEAAIPLFQKHGIEWTETGEPIAEPYAESV